MCFERKATFYFGTNEVQEIMDLFATVKTGKSFGTDNISSYFSKLALPFIDSSLAFLFNTSSCLGPLLFLIHINDLPLAVQDSAVSMYADDTSLCYQSHDLTWLNEAINSDLEKLDTWLKATSLP